MGGRSRGLDERAIREFLKAEFPRLVAAMAMVTGSRAVAEDAVQEALARAWERSERGDHIESLAAWVRTVALNVARSRFKRFLAERRAGERLQAGQRRSEDLTEELIDLRRALVELPRRQREATVLRYYLGLGVAEVGRSLGVSEGTVKTLLFRARRALARALGQPEEEEANEVAGP